jgi:uncharacterized protein YndB with AHSA1/START domain
MGNKPTFEAVIIRQLDAPVKLVYQTWTQAEHLPHWLSPADNVMLEVVRFEFREGGDYYFRYTWDQAGRFDVLGKFLTIVPEDTLIFSWEPQEPDEDAGKQTMVSVWFRRRGPRQTEIEIRHTLFPDEAMRRRHHDGWIGTIDRLTRHLTSLQNPI